MAIEKEKKVRVMPKGGRKGGSRFPRHTLEESLAWAKKLVSKTHLAPQPADVIFAGVVGARSSAGEIRISTLKQFGLLDGKSTAYTASKLSKQINSAPEAELVDLYRTAALTPSIFKGLFNTFHGDVTTKAKLKQRAAGLDVHPDEAEKCVDIYVSSMLTAELISISGENIAHISAVNLNSSLAEVESVEANDFADSAEPDFGEDTADTATERQANAAVVLPSPPRAVFNVNVTLDSSLDIEKLAKQLQLLKSFGAI